MKKFYTILLLLGIMLLPLSGFSQDYKVRGDKAYYSGKYSDAINQYKAALAYLESKKVATTDRTYSEIERLKARAERCAPLMAEAEALYSNAKSASDYTKARNKYNEILQINNLDSYSSSQLQVCDAKISQIKMRQAEEAMWAEVSKGPRSRAVYERYVKEFPNGAHIEEAKNIHLSITDEELWAAAVEEDTKEAYSEYLSNPQTSIYNSEAKLAIKKIDDDLLWADVLEKDTEEAYKAYAESSNSFKGHQEEAVAKLSVFKTRRVIEALSENNAEQTEKAAEIVETLEQAQKTISLSEEDIKLLAYYKSVNEYETFYKNPTLAGGLRFLKAYPDSEYADAVSNKVSELYAKDFNINSTENDYQLARSYARSAAAQNYVEDRIKLVKKAAKKAEHGDLSLLNLGIGVDAEFGQANLAFGPRLEFKIGSYSNAVNFSVGAKALFWNSADQSGEGNLSFTQIPVYAGLKLNLFKAGKKSRFYIAGEGAYNWNISPSYGEYSESLDGDFLQPNMSVTGRIGFCWKHSDLSIYYRQDLTPIYNQEYIYDNYDNLYNEFYDAINNRMRIGLAYTVYFGL